MQLFSYYPYPFFFKASSSFLSFLFAWIIYFIAFFDMFLVLSCFQHILAQICVLLCLLTCLLVPIYMFMCFMPCLVLRSMFSHGYMFRSTCFMLYAMLSMLRSIFPICCLARFTCFHACLHVYLSFLHVICFIPYFPMFCSSFCSMLILGLHAHMLDIMSMVMPCSDLCVRMLFAMFYAQIHFRTCLYAWIHVLPCLFASFHMFTHTLPCLCLDLHFYMLACLDLGFHMLICLDLCSYMLICLDLCLHMLVCLDLCSTCFMPSSMCLCAPWSLSLSVHLGPYQRVWITRCACLCFLASMLYACVSLSSSRLFQAWRPQRVVVVWLHPTPMRPCLGATTWDASPQCQLLRAYLSPFPLHAMICLPCLFVRLVGFLCIFTLLLACPCMSLACQCVVHASTQ